MFFIIYNKGKRRDKVPKGQMTREKSLRFIEFQKWQGHRVVNEFDETEIGSKSKALIDKQLAEYRRLKSKKPIAWEARADVVKNTIAISRIEYIEELIKFVRKQKGICKSTINELEQQLKLFKSGMAWWVE